jgi:hypothetical protein
MGTNRFGLSKLFLEVIAFVWVCIEIGQFVEIHTGFEQNNLFWPFWICLSLAVVQAIRLLEIYLRREK